MDNAGQVKVRKKIKILMLDIVSLRYLLSIQHKDVKYHFYIHIRNLGKIAKQMISSL